MKTWKSTILAFILALALATPSVAADWSFYGSARMRTWHYKADADKSDTGNERTQTLWAMQGNSRIGATIKAGDFGGRFEYGGTSYVFLRRLYGTWNFGKGTLLVGQEYTPLDATISSQVALQDLGLNGWGTLFSRKPMMQVSMMNFKIALVDPSTSDLDGRYVNDPNNATAAADTEVIIPSIEAAYTYHTDQLMLQGIAGFSTYKIVDADNDKEAVNRWLVGALATYDIASFWVAAQFQYGQNMGTWAIAADWEGYAAAGWGPASNAEPIVDDGDVKNNYGYGYAFECGYILNDTFKFSAGLGGVSYKVDMSGTSYDNGLALYLNAHIYVSKNAFVAPEVGYFDSMHNGFGEAEGNSRYIGAKWQIDF